MSDEKKKKKVTKKPVKLKTKKPVKIKVSKKKAVKKPAKPKRAKKAKQKKVRDIHDLSLVLRRKKIICHTCKYESTCMDAIKKSYPLVCMIYVVRDENA